MLILNYSDQYNEHFVKTYVYAWFEFGRVEEDHGRLIKQYLDDETRGKDCFGSVNHYKGWLDGLLMMTHDFFGKLQSEMRDMFQV